MIIGLGKNVSFKKGNQHKKKTARALLSGIYDLENYFFLDVEIHRVNSNGIILAKGI